MIFFEKYLHLIHRAGCALPGVFAVDAICQLGFPFKV